MNEMKRSLQFRLLLAAMPLLAGLHEAFTAANRYLEQQQGIDWPSTFFSEVAIRLPISLILAVAVFALISAAGALLLRLEHASVSAQAARYDINLKEITPVAPNPKRMKSTARRSSGVRGFQLGRVA
jgi:hypothetical protein